MTSWKRLWVKVKTGFCCLLYWRARRRVAWLAMELGWHHLYARRFDVAISDDTMSSILCDMSIFVEFGLRTGEPRAYAAALCELDKHTRVSAETLRHYLQEAFAIIWHGEISDD